MTRISLLLVLCFCVIYAAGKPNIILIVGDDMGWNDVGFHGSNQIPTPNIDALGYNGVILNKFYAQATCTPSRAALLTGQYPMRIGFQGYPMKAGENRYIPLDVTTLPEELKTLGYDTHLVGKWHLGFACNKYSPTGRGFDQHFGYWNGYVGYFNYTITDGFDLHDGLDPAWSYDNKYATDVFTEKAIDVIENHDSENPLFLMVTHIAAHTGYDGVALEVPDIEEANEKFGYIEETKRRLYADIVNRLDESVGKIVKALSDTGMLENSVVMFISDNGGPTVGEMENSSSNWPLKGLKNTLFEGGVRVVAALYSPLLTNKRYVNEEIIHITDLFATFYKLGGGNTTELTNRDGIDQWDTISENQSTQRQEILLDFDEVEYKKAIISYNGRFKYIKGPYVNDSYTHLGESGRSGYVPSYNTQEILNSDVNKAILSCSSDSPLTEVDILSIRASEYLYCINAHRTEELTCSEGCLFDLKNDPCEYVNIASYYTDITEELKAELDVFEKQLMPQGDRSIDPRSNPENFGGVWTNWLEGIEC